MTNSRFLLASAALAALSLTAVPDVRAACGEEAPTTLVETLVREADGLRPEVLRLALESAGCAAKQGLVGRRDLLTVIDYSLPSTKPRMFVFDLEARRLLFRELVAHGKNSGDNFTRRFSNEDGSLQTSLGLFVTGGTYVGNNGYSLRLRGLDAGFNDRAWQRAIVLHGAKYVSDSTARALGRIGRSWGCPAVRDEIAHKLIDTLKGGSPIFAYYPQESWLKSSPFL